MSNFLIDDLMKSNPAAKSVAVSLPTNAEFYNVGEVLSTEADPANIEIFPVSLLEENMFNDPFLILSGKATTQLIKRVAPEVINPDKLAEVDVEAILLASRLASNGEKLSVTHVCQNPTVKEGIELDAQSERKDEFFECRNKTDIQINLLQEILINYRPFNEIEGFLDNLICVLPGSNQKVYIKPISFEDGMYLFKKLYTTYEADKNENFDIFDEVSVEKYSNKFTEMQTLAVEAILSYIMYVESSSGQKTSDFDIIREWFGKLDKRQVDAIQEKISSLKTHIEGLAKVKYTCGSCGHENTFRLEFDPQKLFTKAVDTVTPIQSSAPLKKTAKTEKTSSRILQR